MSPRQDCGEYGSTFEEQNENIKWHFISSFHPPILSPCLLASRKSHHYMLNIVILHAILGECVRVACYFPSNPAWIKVRLHQRFNANLRPYRIGCLFTGRKVSVMNLWASLESGYQTVFGQYLIRSSFLFYLTLIVLLLFLSFLPFIIMVFEAMLVWALTKKSWHGISWGERVAYVCDTGQFWTEVYVLKVGAAIQCAP